MDLIEGLLAFLFALHLIYAFGFIIPKIGAEVREICHEHWNCARHIRNSGTYFNYEVDLGDGQWREFRNSLGILAIAAILTCLASFLLRSIKRNSPLIWGVMLRLVIGVIVLFVQHGYHSFIVLILSLIGYLLTKLPWKKCTPAVVWTYALCVLLFKESYRLRHLPAFHFLIPLFDRRYGGMYGWQLPANFLVLRMISYSMDYYWSDHTLRIKKQNDNTTNTTTTTSNSNQSEDTEGLSIEEYGLFHYLAYVLYAPLYMAGPIITYDNFIKSLKLQHSNYSIQKDNEKLRKEKVQLDYDNSGSITSSSDTTTNINDLNTATTITTTTKENNTLSVQASTPSGDYIWFYLFRWIACFILMEYMLNKYPFFAIANSNLLPTLNTTQTAIVSYILLKIMWLKFLLLWRFFRLWALFDQINAPENMNRCMSNNYSLESFWKGWHSSYNKFLVKYIYKPLGGRDNQLYSVWIIFIFVALWHDFEIKLFLWGGLNALFYALEVIVKHYVNKNQIFKQFPIYIINLIYAISGASYIMILISINLIGYGIGIGGINIIINKIFSNEGMKTCLICFYFLIIGVLIMQQLKRLKLTSNS